MKPDEVRAADICWSEHEHDVQPSVRGAGSIRQQSLIRGMKLVCILQHRDRQNAIPNSAQVKHSSTVDFTQLWWINKAYKMR